MLQYGEFTRGQAQKAAKLIQGVYPDASAPWNNNEIVYTDFNGFSHSVYLGYRKEQGAKLVTSTLGKLTPFTTEEEVETFVNAFALQHPSYEYDDVTAVIDVKGRLGVTLDGQNPKIPSTFVLNKPVFFNLGLYNRQKDYTIEIKNAKNINGMSIYTYEGAEEYPVTLILDITSKEYEKIPKHIFKGTYTLEIVCTDKVLTFDNPEEYTSPGYSFPTSNEDSYCLEDESAYDMYMAGEVKNSLKRQKIRQVKTVGEQVLFTVWWEKFLDSGADVHLNFKFENGGIRCLNNGWEFNISEIKTIKKALENLKNRGEVIDVDTFSEEFDIVDTNTDVIVPEGFELIRQSSRATNFFVQKGGDVLAFSLKKRAGFIDCSQCHDLQEVEDAIVATGKVKNVFTFDPNYGSSRNVKTVKICELVENLQGCPFFEWEIERVIFPSTYTDVVSNLSGLTGAKVKNISFSNFTKFE